MFWFVIGISGVTCGGKTTLAKSLYDYFNDPRNSEKFKENIIIDKVYCIHQDDYFLPDDSPKHEWIQRINHINYDILSSIDMQKMCEDLKSILGNDFKLFTCDEYQKLQIQQQQQQDTHINIKLNILIIEGLLIFNHPITYSLCQIKYHIHLPYEKCFTRRKEREYVPPDCTGYFEICVWPMYEKHFGELCEYESIQIINGEISQEKCFNYVLNTIQNSF